MNDLQHVRDVYTNKENYQCFFFCFFFFKEFLPFTTTWMELEDIMLKEINRT